MNFEICAEMNKRLPQKSSWPALTEIIAWLESYAVIGRFGQRTFRPRRFGSGRFGLKLRE